MGLGANLVSVHALAPYPGWESFLQQTCDLIEALPSDVIGAPVLSVGVMYIDRVKLPPGQWAEVGEYFTIAPRPLAPMPNEQPSFFSVFESRDSQDGTMARLELSTVLNEGSDTPDIVWALALRRDGQPLCSFDRSSWQPVVDALHVRQRDIFESSITDKARALFQ